ncbi:MAG: PAS domain-containing hybrid sensor histidine kinase/response regulator [Opitutales bacterium]
MHQRYPEALILISDAAWWNMLIGVHVIGMVALVGVILWRFRGASKGLHVDDDEKFNAWARATEPLYRTGARLWIAVDARGVIVRANTASKEWFSPDGEIAIEGMNLEDLDASLSALGSGEFVHNFSNGPYVNRTIEGWVHIFQSDSESGDENPIGRVITAVDRTLRGERGEQLHEVVTSLSGLSGDDLIDKAVDCMSSLLDDSRVFLATDSLHDPNVLKVIAASEVGDDEAFSLPNSLNLDDDLWAELVNSVCITYLRDFPATANPELHWVRSMIGMTMRDEVNAVMGVCVIVSKKPILDPFYTEGVMRLVLMRLRGELIEIRQTQALQRAHDYYKNVLDSVPVLIWQSQEALSERIIFNKTWLSFRGAPSESEDGGGWLEGLHPDERESVVDRLKTYSDKRESFEHIYRLRNAEGKYCWILEKGHPHRDENGNFKGFFGACTDISDRHKAERDLRIHQAAFESTSSGVVIARADKIRAPVVYCNESFCRYYGMPRDHILGKHLAHIIGHGADSQSVERLDTLLLGGRAGSLEVEVTGADGARRWMRSSFTPISGPSLEHLHWVCLVSETTFEKQEHLASVREKEALSIELTHQRGVLSDREKALKLESDERRRAEQSSALLRSALNHIDIPTVMVRKDGSVVYINDAGTAELSLHPGATVYYLWTDPTDSNPWGPDNWAHLMVRLGNSDVESREIKISSAGDAKASRVFEVRFKHVFFEDEEFVTCIFVDLSESLEVQGELVAQTDALLKSSELKSQFVATMSHELRTPLNSILMLTEALLSDIYGELNNGQRKSLKTLEDSGLHLLALINDVLDLSKIEAGKMEIRRERVVVKDFCRGILDAFQEQAKQDGIDLSLKLNPGLDYVELDKRRFRQIIVNLLGNALDFTPKNGVVTFDVSHDDLEDEMTFAITDTGPGIPAKDHTKLFQPFVQLDGGNTRRREGSGLGLSLAREFAELHGGRIEVKSELGVGSQFSVVVPAPRFNLRTDGIVYDKKSRSPFAFDSSIGDKKVVLVVDDHLKNQTLVKDYLVSCGYQVLTASDGKAAVEKAIGLKPDVVLMDIQMPIMDGYEAMRAIRRDPDGARLGIIAMTALAMEGDRETCLKEGADDYISKPVKLSELAERVETLANQSV